MESYIFKDDELLGNRIPISLGWNCNPAGHRANGYNFRRSTGYLTCPFDLGVTPYYGLCQCLLDNFDRKKFFNLRIEYDELNLQFCILNEYNMWFNHESEPYNKHEKIHWTPGKWEDNNFVLFIERYERRIQNFLNYINNNNILFIIENPYDSIDILINIIKYTYPNLNFKILLTKFTHGLYFNQHLHSPGFPKNENDQEYFSLCNNLIWNNFNKNDYNPQISNSALDNQQINSNGKPKYRAVILILASNQNNICKNARKIWKYYMNIDPSFKVYFVYGELDEPLENYDSESDLIYQDIKESYPVYFQKTLRAMAEIDSKVSYDFFVRTNISTFWDFEKLHMHLNELPKEKCYSGDGPLHGFYLSGVDTIVTPEMIKSIVENSHLLNFSLAEDATMGEYFHRHLGVPMLPNRICFFEEFTIIDNIQERVIREKIIENINNQTDHYRVKTLNGPREEIDLVIYKLLLEYIYNIYIDI